MKIGALCHFISFGITPLLCGQTLEILHRWTDPDSGPWAPRIQRADGSFYGTTYHRRVPPSDSSWAPGTIYMMTPDGHVTTMVQFTEIDGVNLNGLVQVSDGNLFRRNSADQLGRIRQRPDSENGGC